MNDMVLQKLEGGLLTITMNRPGAEERAQPRHGRGAGRGRAARGRRSRGARGAVQRRRRLVLRRRGRQVDGGRPCAAAVRSENGEPAPRHGSVAHPAPDAKARGGAARRRGSRRRPFDGTVLRPAHRERILQDHDRLRQGRLLRRLWRHLFPDAAARQRAGARALSDVAGALGEGGVCDRHGDESRSRRAEIDAAAHELALSLAQGPSIALGFIKRNINNAEHLALEDCFDGEAIHHTRCSDTEDHKEAAKAFVEKRKPTFKGA
ncbi:2-(1,2-epoxy-1,2-dihydrophenyl)acetyl-CoA isomerase [Bradyrhizobium sp. i1.3.1]